MEDQWSSGITDIAVYSMTRQCHAHKMTMTYLECLLQQLKMKLTRYDNEISYPRFSGEELRTIGPLL